MRFALRLLLGLTLLGCGSPNPNGDAGGMDSGEDSGPSLDAGPGGARVGAPCARDGDCESGVCFPAGFGAGVCTEACRDASECPAGWTCDDFGGSDVCQCETGAESCNGLDDDCDGTVDEGRAESIGCADGELCSRGSCQCPSARTCGDNCVDTEADPRHCGDCDNACGVGQVCNSGDCCTVAAETCNGVDDDCDGAVDEAFGAAVACGANEACVSGACECPSDRMCAGGCADIQTEAAHCGECDNACPSGEECVDGGCCDAVGARVDLLLVVDNSGSMSEEQASLRRELPELIRVLATGDLDMDGAPESEPVRDLNLGVVTTDMGSGGFTVPTCLDSSFGDDGVLRTEGRPDIAGCEAAYPSFLNFVPSAADADPGAFAAEAACLATVGTGGCGIEQPLEALLKAVTPATSAVRFFEDSSGHGDGDNAGFLRPDSLLVAVVLTEENDCSALDPELFNRDSSTYPADLNIRCFEHPEALHPLSRYVDGLLATRQDPRDLIFAQITGVPADTVSAGQAANYEAIFADPRMEEQEDPFNPNQLLPSCTIPGRGLAFPPRRILRLGQSLEDRGATTIVGSICQDSFREPMTDVLRAVLSRLRESCAEN